MSLDYRFTCRAAEGLAIVVAGVEVVCRPSGALWIEAEGALVVADLHLEKGSAYASRGQLLPPYDTDETLGRLEDEARALAPRLIVLLGDTLHDAGGEARMSADAAGRLAALARRRTLVWILGNHDRAGKGALAGDTVGSLSVNGLRLVHEPADGQATAEVGGHLHPCAKVAGRGGAVRRRCFVTDGGRLVLPAFGAYAGGLNVRDAAFQRLLRHPPLAAVLGDARVHPVGWRRLRAD